MLNGGAAECAGHVGGRAEMCKEMCFQFRGNPVLVSVRAAWLATDVGYGKTTREIPI